MVTAAPTENPSALSVIMFISATAVGEITTGNLSVVQDELPHPQTNRREIE
jgi:hypothetical protein